ncbi:MAG: ABC transporter ATP-binding protein [Oscillospiraceae bacterium]|nr:ABC transporter ATP-binding protein [Oscillospiraceae bacterium]
MIGYKNAIEIEGLTKKFDGFTLSDISFNVPRGSIMGFIGQNGAGKTTTIKAILNIIKADKGSIKILGEDHIKDEIDIKERISAVFDELPFHDDFTAKNLDVILRHIYENWDKNEFASMLDRFALPRNKKIGKFSKGMKMKLQIACALSHKSELLIMDEPTTGLDPVVRNEILDIFREYIQDENHSILMSSHITGDLEKISDSVTFIDKGRLLISGYKDDILESHGIIKCGKEDYKKISSEDIISARLSDFGAEVMISDKVECREKYPGLVMDNATLEEIMLFYVNEEKKEWK